MVDNMDAKQIRVEVVYALPNEQKIIELYVPEGTTVLQAAERSGLSQHYPEIDLATVSLGIFSKLVKAPKEQVLRENDRVEIYRPLIADPKKVRANRAAKQKKT
ncbi:RnfH family protein [Oceanospirillum sp.]|uniref:RnfH family protein n=1 Tax=Oceanospirillum sp. TaxID=2021254 RepID=UPI003A921FC5